MCIRDSSYTAQAHLPRNSNPHRGLGPLTSNSNKECLPQTRPHTNLMEAVPQLRLLLSQVTLDFVSYWQNLTGNDRTGFLFVSSSATVQAVWLLYPVTPIILITGKTWGWQWGQRGHSCDPASPYILKLKSQFYKKAGWASQGKQACKKHPSMASASAPVSWPAWVPVLTSLVMNSIQYGSVSWINPFLPNLLLDHDVLSRNRIPD